MNSFLISPLSHFLRKDLLDEMHSACKKLLMTNGSKHETLMMQLEVAWKQTGASQFILPLIHCFQQLQREKVEWTQGKYESLPLAVACNDVFCPQTAVSVSRCTEFINSKYNSFKGNNVIITIYIIGMIYS